MTQLITPLSARVTPVPGRSNILTMAESGIMVLWALHTHTNLPALQRHRTGFMARLSGVDLPIVHPTRLTR